MLFRIHHDNYMLQRCVALRCVAFTLNYIRDSPRHNLSVKPAILTQHEPQYVKSRFPHYYQLTPTHLVRHRYAFSHCVATLSYIKSPTNIHPIHSDGAPPPTNEGKDIISISGARCHTTSIQKNTHAIPCTEYHVLKKQTQKRLFATSITHSPAGTA